MCTSLHKDLFEVLFHTEVTALGEEFVWYYSFAYFNLGALYFITYFFYLLIARQFHLECLKDLLAFTPQVFENKN